MLLEVVQKYLKLYPKEQDNLSILLHQLKKSEDLSDRNNYRGHIAGSGLIFSPDHKKILLIFHPTFERWMQPGGHLEPDEDGPWQTAERESAEETGATFARRIFDKDERLPLLIESHIVPSRPPKNEPEHYHHGFWYGFVASSEKLKLEDAVITQARWAELDEIDEPNMIIALKRAKHLLDS